MNYTDLWKKKMKNQGASISDSREKHSKLLIQRSFKDDPSYRDVILTKLDLTTENIGVRVVNTDKPNEKKLYILPDQNIDTGSYIKFEDKTFLVLGIEYNLLSPCVKVKECNQIIHMPNDINIHAIVEGESYGVKLIGSSDYFSEADTKVKVTVGDNEMNRKYLVLDSRFCFGNSEHGIYKNADISVYQKGLLVNICKKDKYLKGLDDLNTSIMYQGNTENLPDTPQEPTNYEIVGQDTIKINQEYSYSLTPSNTNATFSLVEYSEGTAEIINQNNGECTIKAVKSDEIITLSASVNEKMVATINILTARR